MSACMDGPSELDQSSRSDATAQADVPTRWLLVAGILVASVVAGWGARLIATPSPEQSAAEAALIANTDAHRVQVEALQRQIDALHDEAIQDAIATDLIRGQIDRLTAAPASPRLPVPVLDGRRRHAEAVLVEVLASIAGPGRAPTAWRRSLIDRMVAVTESDPSADAALTEAMEAADVDRSIWWR